MLVFSFGCGVDVEKHGAAEVALDSPRAMEAAFRKGRANILIADKRGRIDFWQWSDGRQRMNSEKPS